MGCLSCLALWFCNTRAREGSFFGNGNGIWEGREGGEEKKGGVRIPPYDDSSRSRGGTLVSYDQASAMAAMSMKRCFYSPHILLPLLYPYTCLSTLRRG